MKTTMTMAAALLALAAYAQTAEVEAEVIPTEDSAVEVTAATEESAPVGQGAGVEAILEAQEAEEPKSEPTADEPAPTADEMLQEWLNGKDGLENGYDAEKNRIIVINSIEFDIKNPKVSKEFIKIRTEKMSQLLLQAKAEIIETIMSSMSASRILDIPGNPIAVQMEEEMEEINGEIKVMGEELAEMDAKLAESLKNRDTMTHNEIFSVISSWFTRSGEENLAQTLTEEKKAAYDKAYENFKVAQKRYDEVLEKAETLKGKLSESLSTNISRVSAMPIYGCTILQQAETYTKESSGAYKCRMAIVYAWSNEMQTAAGEILKGESIPFTPGKKSIKQWLSSKAKTGAFASWVGPRQYIDDKGNMWFLGISCTPVAKRATENNKARLIANINAAAEVMFSLYADASTSSTVEKLMQTKVGANGEDETKVYEDVHTKQQESFKDIQISGNSKLWSGTVRHPASGLDLNVSIYGVNSGSVKALKAIQTASHALGIEVNTAQEVERGRQQQMKQSFESSKSNAAARATGAAQARSELDAEAAKAKERRAQRKQQAATFKEDKTKSATPNKTKGQLRAGGTFVIDDDDE